MKNIKRKFVIWFVVLILIILSATFVGCRETKDNGSEDSQKEEILTKENLPYCLFDSTGKCIAFTHNGHLYSIKTKKYLGFFDEERQIFRYSNYVGEIYDKDLLLYNTQSEYIGMHFIAPIKPITPIGKISQYRLVKPTNIPYYYKDVEIKEGFDIFK